jgi:hypothetical protein
VKYLILIYHNERTLAAWAAMSPEQRAQGMAMHTAFRDELGNSGELVISERLADPATARVVAVRDGRTTATDGPFAEVKEHLAGFYLVECESVERAVELAARIPEASFKEVEVRPVLGRGGTDG